ncbi:hypothetical protein BGZ57DRAFT_835949 [Hyaloscypha finlandica]|nr:hypothetical protein BGZ57DRAFT_835949 [Hyaloscypha finlandica]
MTLRKTKLDWCKKIAINVLMVLSPMSFLVLAGINARLHSHVVESKILDRVQSANKIATTVFPLVFTGIMGRTIMKIAGWKLEKGTSLGTLEQLTGSRTVFGAVHTQFHLGSYNLMGLALILIWIMSPIGGQSTSRLLGTNHHETNRSTLVHYTDTRGSLFSTWLSLDGSNSYDVGLLSTVLSASITAPLVVKNSSLDLWGNVKIPYLLSSESSWSPTGQMDSSSYSSTVGLPIFGLPDGRTTFSVESTQVQLNCTTLRPKVNSNSSTGIEISLNSDNYIQVQNFSNKSRIFQGFNYTDLYDLTIDPSISAGTLPGGSWVNGTLAECNPTQIYVESQLSCMTSAGIPNCSVVAQRPSLDPLTNANLTWLNLGGSFELASLYLPQFFGKSLQTMDEYDIAQRYLSTPDTTQMYREFATPLYEIDRIQFGRRLGQLINGLIIASTATMYVSGTNTDQVPPYGLYDYQHPSNATQYQNTTGFVITVDEVYVCSWPWLVISMSATTILIVAAVLGSVYDLKKQTPDILGHCSTMIRDSKYVSLPQGGNLLDGLERTRMLGYLKIKLGEVNLQEGEDILDSRRGVGHLAVADIDRAGGIRQGGLYI